jgi:hypothetical protein
MSCQNKYTNCKKSTMKQEYRLAKKQHPLIDNPYEKWECTKEVEESCPEFKPFPPKMTDIQFAEKQTEILKDIPEEFKGALSYMAYEIGHASGNEEVIIALNDLVSNLKEPIRKFEKRIREEITQFHKIYETSPSIK